MNQFFRISLAIAMAVFMTSSVQGIKGLRTIGGAVALKALRNNNNNDPQPQTPPSPTLPPQSSTPPAAAASTGLAAMQTSGQLVAVALTKMQTIIKYVTSCAYPYRCSVFAGDYCQRQCSVICAPPL